MSLLHALPSSILVEHVFQWLCPRDLYVSTQTCHTWLKLVEEYAHVLGAWSSVVVPGGRSLKRKADEMFEYESSSTTLVAKRALCIRKLRITSFRATIEDLQFASQCSRLQVLDIRSLHPVFNLTADLLQTLSTRCPHITTLGIPPSVFVRTKETLFPQVRKLIVCGGSSAQIQSYCTLPLGKLEELELIDFDMSHGLLISMCSNLSSLSLLRCWRNGEWREGDHPFHPNDVMFADVLFNLKRFTLCGSESAFCANAVVESIFVRREWTQLESLTMDSITYTYSTCDTDSHDVADYVCTECSLGDADLCVLDYNHYYKSKSFALKYTRCSTCRAAEPSWLRTVTILWW